MHRGERELYEIMKAGDNLKTSDVVSRSRICKATALKESEETTGKKAFVLMSAEDLGAKFGCMKVSLLEGGSPLFEMVAEARWVTYVKQDTDS